MVRFGLRSNRFDLRRIKWKMTFQKCFHVFCFLLFTCSSTVLTFFFFRSHERNIINFVLIFPAAVFYVCWWMSRLMKVSFRFYGLSNLSRFWKIVKSVQPVRFGLVWFASRSICYKTGCGLVCNSEIRWFGLKLWIEHCLPILTLAFVISRSLNMLKGAGWPNSLAKKC